MKGKANYQLTEECPLYTTGHLAVWFGNESRGVSDEAVTAADGCDSIPMNGGFTESFNLGCTTGIVMHHIANIRREYSQMKAERKIERKIHNPPPTKRPRL
jgi:tRNA (guanosine-2'-O-)-methyltransferase